MGGDHSYRDRLDDERPRARADAQAGLGGRLPPGRRRGSARADPRGRAAPHPGAPRRAGRQPLRGDAPRAARAGRGRAARPGARARRAVRLPRDAARLLAGPAGGELALGAAARAAGARGASGPAGRTAARAGPPPEGRRRGLTASTYSLPPARLGRWLARWVEAHGAVASARVE